MQDLGTLPGDVSSCANGINGTGQVVGSSTDNSRNSHAFLFSGGLIMGLGTLGGRASFAGGINNAGQVVGWADTASGDSHAFLYNGGTMIDLNTLIDPSTGWTLEGASAINDLGQIVGYGYNAAGDYDPFLLTPTPEPATLSLLALGGLAILRLRSGQGVRREKSWSVARGE